MDYNENEFQFHFKKSSPMTRIDLRPYLAGRGLRRSQRRERVAETFLAQKEHLSAEELLALVRRKDKQIGRATVYRTLKLLTDCGLAVERKFNRQVSMFEPLSPGRHHDHLICLGCGAIVEFANPTIEALQEEVALKHRFTPTHHVLEMYGYCRKCRSKTPRVPKKP